MSSGRRWASVDSAEHEGRRREDGASAQDRGKPRGRGGGPAPAPAWAADADEGESIGDIKHLMWGKGGRPRDDQPSPPPKPQPAPKMTAEELKLRDERMRAAVATTGTADPTGWSPVAALGAQYYAVRDGSDVGDGPKLTFAAFEQRHAHMRLWREQVAPNLQNLGDTFDLQQFGKKYYAGPDWPGGKKGKKSFQLSRGVVTVPSIGAQHATAPWLCFDVGLVRLG